MGLLVSACDSLLLAFCHRETQSARLSKGNRSKCCNCTNKTNKTNPKVSKCCNYTKQNNKTNSPGVLETGRLGLRTPGELVLLVFLVQLQHFATLGLVLLLLLVQLQHFEWFPSECVGCPHGLQWLWVQESSSSSKSSIWVLRVLRCGSGAFMLCFEQMW